LHELLHHLPHPITAVSSTPENMCKQFHHSCGMLCHHSELMAGYVDFCVFHMLLQQAKGMTKLRGLPS
jgi:hypothetical protein